MDIEQYITFIMIITILLLSPGPSVLLSINNGLNYSLKLAAVGVCGNVVAFQLLMIVSAAGLGPLVLTSNEILIVIKTIGAIYLCYLGFKAYYSPVSPLSQESSCTTYGQKPLIIFKQAFLVTVSNPKALMFVSALLPQFIKPASPLIPQVILLCLISAMIHFTIYFCYAALASKAKNLLNSDKKRRRFNQLSGLIFFMFGISLALSSFLT
jgi:threonine/homoserine/homoserine lactone efflux protein